MKTATEVIVSSGTVTMQALSLTTGWVDFTPSSVTPYIKVVVDLG